MHVPAKILKGAVAATLAAVLLSACSGMTETEQRMVSGGAIGAAGGAGVSAATGGSLSTGALLGGAAGTAGGYLYDRHQRQQGR